MDTFETVRKLQARQRALLESLPPDLLAEYQEIESAIRHIDRLLYEKGASVQVALAARLQELLEQPEGGNRRPHRVPLAQRRMTLRAYLQAYGPASRGQILANTNIPPGSLSCLLTEGGVEKTSAGLWRLKVK